MTKVFNKKTAKRAVSVVLLLLMAFTTLFVLPITAAAKSYTITFDYCYDTSNSSRKPQTMDMLSEKSARNCVE